MIKKEMSVIKILKEKYNFLYSAEKKVVDYILDNQDKVIMMNVSELAFNSNVSDATVVRMCQHAGFKGYYQMRLLMSRDLGRMGEIKKVDSKRDPIGYVFEKELDYIGELNNNLNKSRISKASKMIIKSEHVFIVAAGNTIPISSDFEFRLNRFGVRAYTSNVSEKYMNYINNATKKDLLIAISKSGMSNIVIQAAELSKKRGVRIISITGDEKSLLAKLSNCVIYSGKSSNIFARLQHGMETHIGELAIVDAILYKIENIQNEVSTFDRNVELELEISNYKI